MRLKRSSSVGATASEKMLNPRRANRLATRASTPALFSTSTTSVWCRASVPGTDISAPRSCCYAAGRSGHACSVGLRHACSVPSLAVGRVGDDLVVGQAGRHHRVHLLAGIGAEVDDDRAIVDLVGLLDGGVDL